MWEILGEGMLGYVLLVDADAPRDPAPRRRASSTPSGAMARVPFVVAVNRTAEARPGGGGPACARRSTSTRTCPSSPCDATDKDSVKSVLLALLYSVLDEIEADGGPRVSHGPAAACDAGSAPAGRHSRAVPVPIVPGRRSGPRRRGRPWDARRPGSGVADRRDATAPIAPVASIPAAPVLLEVRAPPAPCRSGLERRSPRDGARPPAPVTLGLRRRRQVDAATPTTRGCAPSGRPRPRCSSRRAPEPAPAEVRPRATAARRWCRTGARGTSRDRDGTVSRYDPRGRTREAAGRHPPRGRSGHAATSSASPSIEQSAARSQPGPGAGRPGRAHRVAARRVPRRPDRHALRRPRRHPGRRLRARRACPGTWPAGTRRSRSASRRASSSSPWPTRPTCSPSTTSSRRRRAASTSSRSSPPATTSSRRSTATTAPATSSTT